MEWLVAYVIFDMVIHHPAMLNTVERAIDVLPFGT
jgi:hypothetical protein